MLDFAGVVSWAQCGVKLHCLLYHQLTRPLPPQIAIQDAHGVTLLVQLLNTTQSFEIQELVTGVFWNLSSSEALKIPILKQALDSIVKVALYSSYCQLVLDVVIHQIYFSINSGFPHSLNLNIFLILEYRKYINSISEYYHPPIWLEGVSGADSGRDQLFLIQL